jgi:hypothetical protein
MSNFLPIVSSQLPCIYLRFQVVVLSAYKQIRAQHMDVLSDIDEDNYDRAFAYLRPGIHLNTCAAFSLINVLSNSRCL